LSKLWATFVIVKKLPKESNHPRGEKSPNLVTLLPTEEKGRTQESVRQLAHHSQIGSSA
jgi:hypothetical protein